jgi:hypothetical protein
MVSDVEFMICLMLYTTGCFGAQELGLFCPRAMEFM